MIRSEPKSNRSSLDTYPSPSEKYSSEVVDKFSLRYSANRQNSGDRNSFTAEVTRVSRSACCSGQSGFVKHGAHLTKPGWTKSHTHSNPTNLALFRHKITLYRFNQRGHILLQGAQMGAGVGWGLSPPSPPHFNHWRAVVLTI